MIDFIPTNARDPAHAIITEPFARIFLQEVVDLLWVCHCASEPVTAFLY
jgi:hypothetical protein